VILQADELLALSTIVIAPTSIHGLPTSFRPEVEIERARTRVLVEQLAAVDPSRLGESHNAEESRSYAHQFDCSISVRQGLNPASEA